MLTAYTASKPLLSRNPIGQLRSVRTKRAADWYTNAQRRDERLLQRLETQLARVQAKLKQEELEVAHSTEQAHLEQINSAFKGDRNLKGYNLYFWEKVLSDRDRKELAGHDIKSFDDLFAAYEAAEVKMSKPPFPLVGQLEPRLKCAYNLYETIPQRLNEAKGVESKLFFSRWFHS